MESSEHGETEDVSSSDAAKLFSAVTKTAVTRCDYSHACTWDVGFARRQRFATHLEAGSTIRRNTITILSLVKRWISIMSRHRFVRNLDLDGSWFP